MTDGALRGLAFVALADLFAPLRRRPQWCLYRPELNPTTGHVDKTPLTPATLRHARTNDARTWGTFDAARAALERLGGKGYGVGFVLTFSDPFFAIDLDACLASPQDTPTALARKTLIALPCYAETSPSGRGIHLLGSGRLPRGRRKTTVDGQSVECYDALRFLTITGHPYGDDALPIVPDDGAATNALQTALEAWHAHTFRPDLPPPLAPSNPTGVAALPDAAGDAAVLDRIFRSRRGDRIRRLWEGGNPEGEGVDTSPSAGDFALCVELSFWTQGNFAWIARLFRQSARLRPKWDAHRGGQTYGELTISHAIATYVQRRGPDPAPDPPPDDADPETDDLDPTPIPEDPMPAPDHPADTPDSGPWSRQSAPEEQDATRESSSSSSHGPNGEARTAETSPPPPTDPWPAPLNPIAYYGPIGRLVQLVSPFTEADPVALLGTLLVQFGVQVGDGPHTYVADTRHRTNLFIVFVGRSALARKGMARDIGEAALRAIDPRHPVPILTGLSSAEGLIFRVRDPGGPPTSKHELADPGVLDQRLIVYDDEFARTLRAARRESNVLGQILNLAFDGKPLMVPTRKSPLTSSHAHIGSVASIPRDTLLRDLHTDDMTSGFSNRHCWLLIRRSKLIPEGGPRLVEINGTAEILTELQAVVTRAKQRGCLRRTRDAEEFWRDQYRTVLSVERRGLLGDVTTRSEAIALRLSLIYALADGLDAIHTPHVRAACALVAYSLRSCVVLFGSRTGDFVADRILRALQTAGSAGLSTQAINDVVFSRNLAGDRIGLALTMLEELGWIISRKVPGRGRTATIWAIAPGGGPS